MTESSQKNRPDPERLAALANTLREWAFDLGFDAVGITDTNLGQHPDHLRRWLGAGYQGSMAYLENHADLRARPEALLPGTRRIVSARMPYLQEASATDPATAPLAVLADPTRAYISRYALGRDYHKVLRRRLARLAERLHEAASDFGPYRAFTDSAPVLEKALAAKAGLGWMGKHSLILDRESGSWFFLGEIYTSLPLPADETAEQADACGACHACMTVCPTNAIISPRKLDARRCLAYLTIENKGPIPEALRPALGNRIFGCDDCQLWCPWNREPRYATEADFTPRHGLANASLVALFRWSEEEFLERTQGSALRRINHEQWLRNVAVALGNGPASPDAIGALKARSAHPSTLVREHVQWALSRLGADE